MNASPRSSVSLLPCAIKGTGRASNLLLVDDKGNGLDSRNKLSLRSEIKELLAGQKS